MDRGPLGDRRIVAEAEHHTTTDRRRPLPHRCALGATRLCLSACARCVADVHRRWWKWPHEPLAVYEAAASERTCQLRCRALAPAESQRFGTRHFPSPPGG